MICLELTLVKILLDLSASALGEKIAEVVSPQSNYHEFCSARHIVERLIVHERIEKYVSLHKK